MTLCSGVSILGCGCLRFFRWKGPSECLSTQRICCGVTSHVRKASNACSSEQRSFCNPEYWTMWIGCGKRSNQDRVVSLMFFNIWVTDNVRPATKDSIFNFIEMQLTVIVLKPEYPWRTIVVESLAPYRLCKRHIPAIDTWYPLYDLWPFNITHMSIFLFNDFFLYFYIIT